MSRWCSDGKEMYKIACGTCKVVVSLIKTDYFFAVLLVVAVVVDFVFIQK